MLLRVTLDPDAPLAAVLDADGAKNENGPGGWAGGALPLLRGCSVVSVQAVRSDRIMYVDLASRSAFGVPAQYRIALELEPLKSNILVLRPSAAQSWQILAAAKQIEARGEGRDILVGQAYAGPPPRTARRDRASFLAAIEGVDPGEARALARLLGEFDPACTPALAREVVERSLASDDAARLGERMLEVWSPLRAAVERAADDRNAPVYAWRRGETIATCHLVNLEWPPGAPEVCEDLNTCCAAQFAAKERRSSAPAAAALRKRLATMLDRGTAQTSALERVQAQATEADELRIAGEAIYTYMTLIPERADEFVTPEGLRVDLDPALDAKENAAAYFKRFKKARSGLPHIRARLQALRANREYWEHLLWELDRAESASAESASSDELGAVCDEIAEAIGVRKTKAARPKGKAARRPGLTVALPGGAVAYVGKSPKDNEHVTFAVAGPHDLWFHARGVPGAHVVLKRDAAGKEWSREQIVAAASLAAGRSAAAAAAKVEVDYTERRHVRRQGKGKTGLVWYTDFNTVLVAPRKLT